MKIQALLLCDEFLYARIIEICHQSLTTVLFIHFIATNASATQNKWISEDYWDPGVDCGGQKKCPRQSQHVVHVC